MRPKHSDTLLYDVVGRKATTLSTQATGRFAFDAPDSRAVLFHFRKNDG
jgi:hypothetical protein